VAKSTYAAIAIQILKAGRKGTVTICPVDIMPFLLGSENIIYDDSNMWSSNSTGTII
jgi:hypothetical protein